MELEIDLSRIFLDKWSEYGTIVMYGVFLLDWMYYPLPPSLLRPNLFNLHYSKN